MLKATKLNMQAEHSANDFSKGIPLLEYKPLDIANSVDPGLFFLLTLTEIRGDTHLTRVKAAIDSSECPLDSTALIGVVIQHLQDQLTGISFLSYCDEGCVQERAVKNCGNRRTTYKLVFKVTGEGTSGRNISVANTSKDPKGFVCAVTEDIASERTRCNEWVQLKTDPAKDSNLGLKVGLPVGLAALAGAGVASGLLYRKLRKKNGVADESDTSGILGGTPVISIDDAPNSVPPAGTT